MLLWAKVQETIEFIRTAHDAFPGDDQPLIGVVTGTGLAGVLHGLEIRARLACSALPHFPQGGVASHPGELLAGRLAGVPVLALSGRVHLYEGFSPAMVAYGVRVLHGLGARALILTNAAGSLHPQWPAGSLMAITDHINMTGHSPLVGANEERWGPRFPDMSCAYDPNLRSCATAAALEAGVRLEQGVYVGVTGPQLETPAETRMLRHLGADAVGMSTIMETIVARHMGLRVAGVSCLTNQNLPDCMAETSLEAVVQAATLAAPQLNAILTGMLPRVSRLLAHAELAASRR